MKNYVSNTLCLLMIAAPVILVAMGTITSCALALCVLIAMYFHVKKRPSIWRKFYVTTMRFTNKFLA